MTDDTSRLSRPIAFGISGVGFLIVLVLLIQIWVGVIGWNYYTPAIIFAIVSNLTVLPFLVLMASRKKEYLLPAMIWLHVSMAVMLLYFSQTYSPFTVSWAIMIMLASIYYGWNGFWLSSAGLASMATLYILLFPQNLYEQGGPVGYSFLSVLVVALTVFVSYMFVTIIRNAQHKNIELLNAQRSEQFQVVRLNTLLNSISDAVVTLNKYGRITSQNAAAQVLFDTNQSLIGREIDSLLALTDSVHKPVRVREMIDGTKSSVSRDDLSATLSGEVRHLGVQMARIRSTFNDAEYGVVLIMRDITKQKSLEEEKDEFISVTSHELRTPVAIAEGSLSNLLIMQERGAEQDKLKAAAEEAHKQVVYLAKMINDLSTLSRAERGVGDVIEEIDVVALLNDLFNRYTPEAEAKGLKLNLDNAGGLPHIETSRLYLEEILQNFITNSIKYTKEGSVTMGALMDDDSHIKFFVKDTGIGMSKADVEHIFEKFYRSEDYRTRETSGTGLGLYVVHKLATKLNTKIHVGSRLDHGSTFSFVLPLTIQRFGGETKDAKRAPSNETIAAPIGDTLAKKKDTKDDKKVDEKPENLSENKGLEPVNDTVAQKDEPEQHKAEPRPE